MSKHDPIRDLRAEKKTSPQSAPKKNTSNRVRGQNQASEKTKKHERQAEQSKKQRGRFLKKPLCNIKRAWV